VNRIPAALALFAMAALTACNGGGSSPHVSPSSPGVTPATTPPGGTGSGQSVLTLQSVPSGMTAVVKTSTTAHNIATPGTFTTPFSNFATTVTFTPTNGGAAYVYTTEQTDNGPHTVLYNQTADTSGSIGGVSSSSIHARAMGKSRAVHLVHRTSTGALGRAKYSSTHLIVHYRTDALRAAGHTAADVERAVNVARGVDIERSVRGVETRVVQLASGDRLDALAARLAARPEVQSVKPEALFFAQSTTPVTVNDPNYIDDNYEQWYLYKTQASNAWGYTLGSPTIKVALIDTGVDPSSPDLSGAKVAFGEEILNGVVTPGIPAAIDTDGHGTNVAGLIAAATDNDYGFASIGYNTELQIYRVFPDGNSGNSYSATANESDITLAINAAVAHGAKVINLSLGTCNAQAIDTSLQDAVESAISAGVSVVAASGNERAGGTDPSCGGGSSTIDFPAAFDGVVSVGASALHGDQANVYSSATEYVASYSNSGPGLALVAPGGDPTQADENSNNPTDFLHWIEGLYSTAALDPNNQCPDKTQCFAVFAGTSQATPQVSGTIALMLALNPGLTPAQIKQTLIATADDINDPNEGGGRLDSYRALAAIKGDPNPPALPTNHNFVAFAYTPNGTNVPAILDVTYTQGAPVSSTGTFRIADIPAGTATYKIGVWNDANGDGKIDAGDYFGASGTCSSAAPCASAAGIVAHPVTSGFVLQ
jgi:subtilisin family serine protease